MTRNQQRQDRAAGQHVRRFSFTNQPSTEAEAQARVRELMEEVTFLETRLDHADPDTFDDDDEYARWRSRATSALAHMKSEVLFLQGWLEKEQVARQAFVEQLDQPPADQPLTGTKLARFAHAVRNRAHELAGEYRELYKPRFSFASPPTNLPEAHQRIAELTDVKKRLEGAFSELTADWTSHPLRRADLPGVKAPLQNVMREVEREFAAVKGFIRAQSVRVSDWQLVCEGALSRAVTEGFVLTQQEREALDILRRRHGL